MAASFFMVVLVLLPIKSFGGFGIITPDSNTAQNTNTNVAPTSGSNSQTTNSATQRQTTLTVEEKNEAKQLKDNIKRRFGISMFTKENGTWTPTELKTTQKVLETLPTDFVAATKVISQTHENIDPRVRGYAQVIYDNPVTLSANSPKTTVVNIPARATQITDSGVQASNLKGTTVHEMAHNYSFKHPETLKAFAKLFWPDGKSPVSSPVSDYGKTTVSEDYAEAVREYYELGKYMKSSSPERYEFVKKYVMGGQEYMPNGKPVSDSSDTKGQSLKMKTDQSDSVNQPTTSDQQPAKTKVTPKTYMGY